MLTLRHLIILFIHGTALGASLRRPHQDSQEKLTCDKDSCRHCKDAPHDFGPPPPRRPLKKTALILIGGVGHLQGKSRDTYNTSTPFIPIHVTGNAILENIVRQNPNMDVIAHSWAYPLKEEFLKVFKPVQSQFEDFRPLLPMFEGFMFPRCNINQVSWSYSVKQGVKLMLQEENKTGIRYGAVIFFRPDVLQLKPMSIETIMKDERKVYIEDYHCGLSDIHFIMSRDNAVKFGNAYDWTHEHEIQVHGWIPDYIVQGMGTYTARDSHYWTDEFIYNWMGKNPRMAQRCGELYQYGFSDADAADLGFNCSNETTKMREADLQDVDILARMDSDDEGLCKSLRAQYSRHTP